MRIPLPSQNPDGSYTTERAGLQIDGDGANGQSSLPVYAPDGMKSLDYLRNAGGPGNWYGVVTDTGKANGNPVVQKKGDPCPGAYVSATSYEFPGFSRGDPFRYVDANKVPYIVLPSHWRAEARGVVLGCKAQIEDTHTGNIIEAVVADFGPKAKLGEASIAAANPFGVPSSPKNGGTADLRFRYTFWPDVPAEVMDVRYALIPA
jgi:hypothetical protein